MAAFRKFVVVCAFLCAFQSGFAATNEYYSSSKAKEIIDAMVNAYGGVEKLTALERVKVVMEIREGSTAFKGTLYQTLTKARFDLATSNSKGDINIINVFDGKDFFATVNGQSTPISASARDQLEFGTKEGVFQASILHTFLAKENDVAYRGKKKYGDTEYDVIETTDERGWKKEHYIDPASHREMVTTTTNKQGVRTHVTEAFDEFAGVLYQKRVTIKGADGTTRGSMRVLDVSSDFGDAVFAKN